MKPLYLSPLFALGLAACNNPKAETDNRLNIIYIMTDDHSFQTISAYGSEYIQTPNLDRLANEGLLFSNSFVTNSISGPSRACLLTGKFSHKNGFRTNSDKFDGSQQTFPKLLQQAGYQTAIVGKWHLSSEPTGFDYWNILPGQGEYYNPDFIEMGENKRIEGYATDITTQLATDWIGNRDQNKPFCLLLHHKAPHRTWMPDTTHLGMYEDTVFPIPETFYDTYEGRTAAAQQRMSIDKDMDLVYDLKMYDPQNRSQLLQTRLMKAGIDRLERMTPGQRARWDAHYQPIIDQFVANPPAGKALAEWKYQRYMRDYLACIQSLDENIGALLDYLEKNNLLDNTLIVYTSDQGFYMGEHGWFDKRFMYEESLRTPLLMRMPERFNRRGTVTEMVQNIDHAATFLELAGVNVPADIQGQSIVPLLRNEKPDGWRQSIYYHYYEYPDEHAVKRHYGVRTDRYKLIHFYDDIDEWEFFDLETDPHEMNNSINNPAYKKQIDELKAELIRLQQQYDDNGK